MAIDSKNELLLSRSCYNIDDNNLKVNVPYIILKP